MVFGPAAPPRITLGPPGCTGLGQDQLESKLTWSPANWASSLVQISRHANMFSRVIARRSVYLIPWFAISSLFQPYPMPRMNLPLEIKSRDAHSFANHSGSLWATRVMPVPSIKFSVTAAAAAKPTNWSWVRQYSSGRGGAPSRPPHGVIRLVGM